MIGQVSVDTRWGESRDLNQWNSQIIVQKLIITITIITSDKLPSPSMNTSALSLANAEQTLTRPPYLPFLSETLFSSSFS